MDGGADPVAVASASASLAVSVAGWGSRLGSQALGCLKTKIFLGDDSILLSL
jgi:hypothetical protein